VVKYGIPIGRATRDIAPGEWVHLHNCASYLDEKSSSLDLESGLPKDSAYE
jgi:altronate dehydratase small subunit